jgi:hypothetical protein
VRRSGYLIFQSGYLPKLLGIMMAIAGACSVINGFALVLSPALASSMFPFILLPPFIAELSMAVWLLVKDVNINKWPALSNSVV